MRFFDVITAEDDRVMAHGYVVTLVGQILMVSLPFCALRLSQPVAVVIEAPDGRTERASLLDLTRGAVIALAVISAFGILAATMLAIPHKEVSS